MKCNCKYKYSVFNYNVDGAWHENQCPRYEPLKREFFVFDKKLQKYAKKVVEKNDNE